MPRLPAMLVLAALLAAGCAPAPAPPPVVLITVDTLRADHLGCYGYLRDTSPRLDALARDGLLYTRAHAPMATTLPSHLSLMSGVLPLRHGVLSNHDRFEPDRGARELATIAELFGDHGYQTAAFVSAMPLGRHTGIQAGFGHWEQPPPVERPDAAAAAADPAVVDAWFASLERPAGETTDRVLAWLEAERDPGRPLFLWVHYFDPHGEYAPPAPYDARFEADEDLRARLAERGLESPDAEILAALDAYDGEIAYLDAQLGRLLDGLAAHGLYEPSALVFTADHGEGLGQHGWMDHGRIYQEQLRVPLILKPPAGRGPVGERRDRLASLVDVLPTLAGLLELPLPASTRAAFDGHSLLDGPEPSWVFAQRVDRDRGWGPGPRYALVGRDWKLLLEPQGRDVLYHLASDPAELRDVLAEHPDVADAMRAAVGALLERHAGSDGGAADGPPAAVVEALEALGYTR